MHEIENISEKNLKIANKIIEELQIQKIWQDLDSTCNLVGSVETQLLVNHLDIDFHTYSDDFSIEKSFEAISLISKNPKIKEVYYKNLLDEEDMCLEWHLTYEENPTRIWTIDIIHIKNNSPFVGMIERVTKKIKNSLTTKIKKDILNIKYFSEQEKIKIPSIEIYEAVISHNITNFEEFKIWKKNRTNSNISLWEPK